MIGDFMEWTTTHDVSYLEYEIMTISNTYKSTIKQERQQKKAPTRKPLAISLDNVKVRSKVNVVT